MIILSSQNVKFGIADVKFDIPDVKLTFSNACQLRVPKQVVFRS